MIISYLVYSWLYSFYSKYMYMVRLLSYHIQLASSLYVTYKHH